MSEKHPPNISKVFTNSAILPLPISVYDFQVSASVCWLYYSILVNRLVSAVEQSIFISF